MKIPKKTATEIDIYMEMTKSLFCLKRNIFKTSCLRPENLGVFSFFTRTAHETGRDQQHVFVLCGVDC